MDKARLRRLRAAIERKRGISRPDDVDFDGSFLWGDVDLATLPDEALAKLAGLPWEPAQGRPTDDELQAVIEGMT